MIKYYMPDPTEGGGDKPKKVEAPKGYAPLSIQQRSDWNAFLDYLDKKGVGGSADLDQRDKSLGLGYLNQFRKENPKTLVTPDLIPQIQYEQYLLRKGDAFPGLTPEQLQYVRKGLNPNFLQRPVSDVDGWLGSLTTKQYYPTARRADNAGNKYDFGVDIASYANGLNNPAINENFRVKTVN